MATAQAAPTRSTINLKGSTKIVTEFFSYAVNSILFQRAVYPPEDFSMVKKYGLNMLVTNDDGLKTYISKVISQLSEWLLGNQVSKLVLAIVSKESRETLERWQFDIQNTASDESSQNSEKQNKPKTEKEIHSEIQAIIRQITASVTFLPMIDEPCAFNILIYTSDTEEAKTMQVSDSWVDADPHLIQSDKTEQVRLRSFDTSVHKVEALVAYRVGEEEE
ncbi:Mitotic spindle checkpoint component mad2 [Wallemia ichthyophaga EXF-994]|nr:Mitotic spindle checkpoint component mad2 [Wallemia ichthyophaga EXF-994]EOR01111.1 Mitotic spindle checkpoint component mad2 [Wallemia ichthyophaga EXF-994]